MVANGTRYPLGDPDVRFGTWACPTQQWNKETQKWDFRGFKYIVEVAKEAGRPVWLRPLSTAAAAHANSFPEHWRSIDRFHNGKTYRATDVNDLETWQRVQQYYYEFNEQIVKPYKYMILGIDSCWAASVDGGQPSYVGHIGPRNLTTLFGVSKDRLLEELEVQYGLWGGGMIGHMSPNTSDEFATEWFANKKLRARRQDSRPFRETVDTWKKALLFNWEVDVDIYEITGGYLGAWTEQNGGWYDRMSERYGDDYPENVKRVFDDVRIREGFIWPMAQFPSREEEPEFYSNYLDGADGAFAYVPDQIEAYYKSWHKEGDPIVVKDSQAIEISIVGGKFVSARTDHPSDASNETLNVVGLTEATLLLPIIDGVLWNARVYYEQDEGEEWESVDIVPDPEPNHREDNEFESFHTKGRDYVNVEVNSAGSLPLTKLSYPRNVSASSLVPNSVDVQWDAVGNAEEYEVWLSPVPDIGGDGYGADLSQTHVLFRDVPADNYEVSVRAKADGYETSDYSPSYEVTISDPPDPSGNDGLVELVQSMNILFSAWLVKYGS